MNHALSAKVGLMSTEFDQSLPDSNKTFRAREASGDCVVGQVGVQNHTLSFMLYPTKTAKVQWSSVNSWLSRSNTSGLPGRWWRKPTLPGSRETRRDQRLVTLACR